MCCIAVLLECGFEVRVLVWAEKARVSEWLAHDNAIFDLCWIKVLMLLSFIDT